MRKAHLIPGLLCALVACEGTAPTTYPDGPVALSRMSLNVGSYEYNSALLAVELGSVEDQPRWDALYARIRGHYVPVPTHGPSLDFGDSTVVYAGIGYFSDWRASVHLDSAAVFDGTLTVHYTRREVSGCGVPAAAIAPVDVAQVPRWTGPIRFVQSDSLEVCD